MACRWPPATREFPRCHPTPLSPSHLVTSSCTEPYPVVAIIHVDIRSCATRWISVPRRKGCGGGGAAGAVPWHPARNEWLGGHDRQEAETVRRFWRSS